MAEGKTVNIHLRVLDKDKKSKFTHFDLTNVPKFKFPEELKLFLLENYANVLHPAKSPSFKLGYFVEGRGNKKFDIVDGRTLQLALDMEVDGRINLWVDPHAGEPKLQKEKTKKNKKRKRRKYCV